MGEKVSYGALHMWINAHFIKPETCESCGTNPGVDSIGRNKIHWANKTKKYLRDRGDWLALCPKCHRNYDLNNNIKHRYSGRKT